MSKNRFTSAVIAAAGNSQRMGGGIPKILIEINGIPVIARTLLAYEQAACINEIIVTTKPELIEAVEKLAKEYNITKFQKAVAGGETRADSVRLGLDRINPKAAYIAIADGARCLTTPEMISTVCTSAYINGCATAAAKAQDTVKIGDKGGFIESTPDRKFTWYAQTPQVFSVPIFRAAAYVAYEKKKESTDDNQLVEMIDYPVKLVECGKENLKITTPIDVKFAEVILKDRAESLGKRFAAEDGGYIKI